ncbi:autotransporter domain-containing protein, partial [Ancylobacter sp. FA202]|uniref:autotransporter family protein n=1 Tax=Ancylobacter sp. FA202 TaxID=1111106 RepID=UPI000376E99D
GEWVFSAQNTYTGVTTISAATYSSLPSAPAKLRVNGSLAGGVVVNSGGTLAGSGIVKGTKVNNGGTIAPGNSPGTLTVDGALEMETGSTYQVDVTPTGEHDLLIVTGNVTIANGATLEVIAEPGVYAASSTLTILSSSGTITGTFTNVISDYAFLTPSIESDGQNIFLTLLYNDALFTSYARTPNQFAVAGAAQTLGAGNPVFDAIVSLPADAVPNAYNQLSGELHASAQSVYMEQSSLIRSALADRLRAAQGGVGASSAPVVSYEGAGSALGYGAASPVQVAADLAMPMKAVAAPATTEKFALWTAAFGNWGSFDGNANAASLDASTGGFLMGADATIADGWRLGIAGGYSFTDFSIADRASSGSSENWHIGLYGGKVWGPLALRSGVAYTLQDVSTTRSVGFPGFYDSLTADYDVGTLQAFGELGYRIDTPFAALEPYVNLAYVSLDSGSYAERGGSAALYSSGSDMGTTFTTLGLRVSKALTFDSYEVTLRGVLGWRHAFGDITPAVSQAFVSSDAFTVTGVPIAEDAAVLELGLDMLVGANTTLGIAYTGQFGDGVTQNGFNAVLKASF